MTKLDFSSKKQPKNMTGLKVAVVGSGISGLVSAWFLGQKHQVTLFEKNSKLGGHTNTVDIEINGVNQPVDTGFIVFNRPNYPLLTQMFRYLGVATQDTEMSFSVSVDHGKIEYSGSNLNTLFAQRTNLLSAKHWGMIFEILRFNKLAKKNLREPFVQDISLGEYLDFHGFSAVMRNNYLLPMAAAIWSCPDEEMMNFPAGSFLRFFENHGLLNIEDRPQWETVINGSQNYIDEIIDLNAFEVELNAGVKSVEKLDDKLLLTTESGSEQFFDHVVFASHADQALDILQADLQQTFSLLEHFQYQQNIAYLHSDKALMPRRKLAWAAWNYLRDSQQKSSSVAVSYWMNCLQNLATDTPVIVTLNPVDEPRAELTYKKIVYQHPVFDEAAMDAQQEIKYQQGEDGIWLTGSYLGYGFHEDGLRSAANLAESWGIPLPWHAIEKADNKAFQGAQHG